MGYISRVTIHHLEEFMHCIYLSYRAASPMRLDRWGRSLADLVATHRGGPLGQDRQHDLQETQSGAVVVWLLLYDTGTRDPWSDER